MSLNKLKQQLNDLDEFITWLESIGMYPTITRIGSYRKYLNSYITAVNNGTSKQLHESPEYRDYTRAFYEITELVDIYAGLKKIEVNEELKNRIKIYISGPKNIDDENPSKTTNKSRDFGFELFMGSRLIKCGYNIDFNKEGDLEYKTSDCNLYIECKRPSSEKGLAGNFKKAIKQLEGRYDKDVNGKGIIAISTSKMMNPNHYVLGATNKATLDNVMPKMVQEFIKKNIHLFPKDSSKKTIGLIVLFQTPSYVQDQNNFQISTYTALVAFCSNDSEDFKPLKALFDNLSESFRS